MSKLLNQRQWGYYLWRGLWWLANYLPPAIGERLFRWGGALVFRFASGTRAGAIDNFRHVLGPDASEAEVHAAARAALVHQMYRYYVMLRPLPPDDVWRVLNVVEGLEHVDAALVAGKGMIFLVAHFGMLEHTAQLIRRERGLRPLTPHELIEPRRLMDFLIELREKFGGEGIATDVAAMEMIRRLRRGEAVAIAADLDSTRTGFVVDFFGAPALVPQGPARLALLSGAPLLPIYARQLPDGRYHIIIEAPVSLRRTGDREADALAGTKVVTAIVERWIDAHPTEWTMFNPIWQWAQEKEWESGPVTA